MFLYEHSLSPVRCQAASELLQSKKYVTTFIAESCYYISLGLQFKYPKAEVGRSGI